MTATPCKMADDGVELMVRLTPKGGRDAIDGIRFDGEGRAWLGVHVAAPPDAGKANKSLVKLLAKRLGVAQRSVTLVAGETQRLKRLRIAGDPAALARRVDALSRGDG